jgi:uridine kinase
VPADLPADLPAELPADLPADLPARVVVVAGPSGSGKTVLCRRLSADRGWPVVNLDDFYKDGDDPTLPRVDLPGGRSDSEPVVDWDSPDSWSCGAALDALTTLCRDGQVALPVYDIPSNARVGTRTLELGGASYVLVEGIFADRMAGPCREHGVLADAVCVHNPRLVTFVRRLVRDLREHRKPPGVLVRRGLSLLRAEPGIVARARAAGCRVVSSPQAFEELRALPG